MVCPFFFECPSQATTVTKMLFAMRPRSKGPQAATRAEVRRLFVPMGFKQKSPRVVRQVDGGLAPILRASPPHACHRVLGEILTEEGAWEVQLSACPAD